MLSHVNKIGLSFGCWTFWYIIALWKLLCKRRSWGKNGNIQNLKRVQKHSANPLKNMQHMLSHVNKIGLSFGCWTSWYIIALWKLLCKRRSWGKNGNIQNLERVQKHSANPLKNMQHMLSHVNNRFKFWMLNLLIYYRPLEIALQEKELGQEWKAWECGEGAETPQQMSGLCLVIVLLAGAIKYGYLTGALGLAGSYSPLLSWRSFLAAKLILAPLTSFSMRW